MQGLRHRTRKIRTRGAALVIVLGFVVLITVLVLTSLTRTGADRQLAHGTFNENRADLLARGALDIVIGDIKQEIVAGSAASTVNNCTIYTPSLAANMRPMLSGTPPPAPVASSNMVRRSVRSDPILSPGVPSRASAVSSTTDVSLNGRFVTAARWNKHYLIPRLDASSTAIDSTPIAAFTAPDWVLVTRNGPTAFPAWNPAVKDATPTNSSYVTGRYGYAIYDEGGLLDVNVAGFPSAAPSPPTYVQTIGRKGSIAYADLTSLPTSTAIPAPTFPPIRVNDIVGWRNYASTQPNGTITGNSFVFNATNAQNFINLVTNNTGFLTVSTPPPFNGGTDQTFATRQELLAFRTAPGDTGFSQNALQYFGTFSRELNRPSWKPATVSAINPDLNSIRVSVTFPRRDGTQAIVGEPLLKTRYPLTRINELTDTANTNIQRDFGLQWDGTNIRWNYVGATGSIQPSIKTLAQVAAEDPGREPDFFELLKAVITNGSVGLGSGTSTTATFIPSEPKYYSTTGGLSADYQIMQIGANIIDCWDKGNFPTFINFNGNELAGIENLPYLNKLVFVPSFPPQGSSTQFIDALLVPSLWNPHQNGSAATGSVRIALTGNPTYKATFTVGSSSWTTDAIVTSPTPTIDVPANGFIAPTPPKDQSPMPLGTTGAVIRADPPEKYYGFHFTFAGTPPSASLINQKNADTAYADFGSVSGAGSLELQALFGTLCAPSSTPTPTPTPTPAPGAPLITIQPLDQTVTSPAAATFSATATGNAPLTYQWKKNGTTIVGATSSSYITPATTGADCGSIFQVLVTNALGSATSNTVTLFVNALPKTYQKWVIAATGHPLIAQSVKNNGDFQNTNKISDPEYVALDPRTLRFGIWGTDANGQGGGNGKKDGSYGAEDSLDQGAPANRIELMTWSGPQGGGAPSKFTVGALPADLSLYATNGTASNHYVDLDGVQRQGDWTTDANGTGTKKTIMYASAKSAPAGNYQDRPQIFNGLFPSVPEPGFQSVAELGQVFRDQPWKTLNFTTTNSGDVGLLDAFTLQDVQLTAGKFSLNTRQLAVVKAALSQAALRIDGSSILTSAQATNIATDVVAITVANPVLNKSDLIAQLAGKASFTGLGNKEARECVVRALSDSGQTRTWNLMIDVIAQSGRYPSTATGLANFVVEGEKRYWLHIAIDRFTGEVIDQQLEAVYE
jgi:hypothetical protein